MRYDFKKNTDTGREELLQGRTRSDRRRCRHRLDNPLPFKPDVLHVLYNATADLGFALAAQWGLPYNVLDLWVERRNFTNNKTDGQGSPLPTDLVSTCHDYGINDTISFEEKEANRERIMRGFPFSADEMRHIVEYCRGDVRMTRMLLERMVGQIENIDQALHRGRCMKAITCMEWNGVPVYEPFLRDTINVAYWDGKSKQYPSVKLRMDFRDPNIVGTFVYHCHLLEHEDGGMMGVIRVVPKGSSNLLGAEARTGRPLCGLAYRAAVKRQSVRVSSYAAKNVKANVTGIANGSASF